MAQALLSPEDALEKLKQAGYLADEASAVAVFLSEALDKPLLIEGPAGVGKTALARALAEASARKLIRLQCYEGLDEAKALYEWDYGKQLLFTQQLKAQAGSAETSPALDASGLFDPRFLLERPLLAALRSKQPALLLIDEVDRGDPELEALLLELTSEYQISIPELGTIRASVPPRLILTSNATRELTDALRRRCLYLHLDYPEPSRELAIVRSHVPGAREQLAREVVAKVAELRNLDLKKAPSIAETVDWLRALVLLAADSLGPAVVEASLATLAKHREDEDPIRRALTR